jgi:hypothetical protein
MHGWPIGQVTSTLNVDICQGVRTLGLARDFDKWLIERPDARNWKRRLVIMVLAPVF